MYLLNDFDRSAVFSQSVEFGLGNIWRCEDDEVNGGVGACVWSVMELVGEDAGPDEVFVFIICDILVVEFAIRCKEGDVGVG